MHGRIRLAVIGAVVLALGAATVAYAGTRGGPSSGPDVVALCRSALKGSLSPEDRAWAEQCVRVLTEGTRPPSPSPTVSPTAAPTGTPTAPPPTGFPNAANTGVPDGTPLAKYTGPCTITAANTVIDAKLIGCDLVIRATGVQITRSRVTGTVSTDEGKPYSFTLADSEVNASPHGPEQVTGVGSDNFTVLRSEITGGNRGIYCRRTCVVRDSWVHGQQVAGDWHASGARASQGSKFFHNTLACDAKPTPQDGGCSADLTMYGDFEAVRDVTVEGNLFVANLDIAFCAYGGSTPTKPYSNGAANIVFRDNVFQHGKNGKCGAYDPIDSFDPTRPGNQFVGNRWDTGEPVKPS